MRGKNNWIRSIALGLVLAMSLSTSAITAMADGNETGGVLLRLPLRQQHSKQQRQ